MVYVYYNLRLWVRQLETIPDMEAISLDGIDTTAAWRVEAERPLMESVDDWLEQEVVEGVEGEEEEVTPPTQATPATSRGHGLPPIAPSSSVLEHSKVHCQLHRHLHLEGKGKLLHFLARGVEEISSIRL